MSTLNIRIKNACKPLSDWTLQNPVLLKGEFALVDGENRLKYGDGVTPFNDLDFLSGQEINNITEIPNRSYNDLQDLPNLSGFISVGGNISELNNDSGFITGINNITEIPNRSYNDLQNLPTLYEKFTIEINGLNPLDIENEDIVNLIGGNNVTISRVGNDITFEAIGGVTSWGDIVGLITNQTDLQNALGDKYDASNPDGFVDDAGVSANTDVAANTASRHDAVTLGGTPNYLTIIGQVITQNLIDLETHVTGRLGFGNLPTGTAHSLFGRAGSGNDDISNITIANDRIIGRIGSGDIEGLTGDEVRQISESEKRGLNTISLGNIEGSVALDLSTGSTFTATLTDAITLSFTNVPSGGVGIVLDFVNAEQIIWPAGANAVDGDIPEANGTRYKYILTVRSVSDYDVDGLIDKIEAVV